MGAIFDYFAAIGRTVVTLGDGLAVTGSYFLRKPVTLQYPDRTAQPIVAMLPQRTRGLLEVDLDLCTGCALCEKTCPVSCIKLEVSKGKERLITRFDIDLGKCMHCGLCAECCPTEGLRHTREFEGGTYNPDLLLMHFVEKPLPVMKVTKKGEPEPPRQPVGAVLRRLLPDAWGRRSSKQMQASAEAMAAIDKRLAEERAKAAAAAKAVAEKAAAAKAAGGDKAAATKPAAGADKPAAANKAPAAKPAAPGEAGSPATTPAPAASAARPGVGSGNGDREPAASPALPGAEKAGTAAAEGGASPAEPASKPAAKVGGDA